MHHLQSAAHFLEAFQLVITFCKQKVTYYYAKLSAARAFNVSHCINCFTLQNNVRTIKSL